MNETPPTGSSLLLTRREAAKMLHMCERTLWQRTKDGVIPCVRSGKRWVRYERREVDRFIQNQTEVAGEKLPIAASAACGDSSIGNS
jgi:excisionase family DNA binding protein